MTVTTLEIIMYASIGAALATFGWTLWHRRQLKNVDRLYRDLDREWIRVEHEHRQLDQKWSELAEAVGHHHALIAEWNVPDP